MLNLLLSLTCCIAMSCTAVMYFKSQGGGGGRPGIYTLLAHAFNLNYVNFNCDVCEWVGLNR